MCHLLGGSTVLNSQPLLSVMRSRNYSCKMYSYTQGKMILTVKTVNCHNFYVHGVQFKSMLIINFVALITTT